MIKKRQISIFTLYDLGPWVLITAGTGNGSITQCINLDDTFAYVLWNTLFYCTLRFGTFSSSCHVLLLNSFFYDVFLDILLKCRIIKMRLLLQKYDNPIMLSKSWIKLLLLKLCEEFAYSKFKLYIIRSNLQNLIGFLSQIFYDSNLQYRIDLKIHWLRIFWDFWKECLKISLMFFLESHKQNI